MSPKEVSIFFVQNKEFRDDSQFDTLLVFYGSVEHLCFEVSARRKQALLLYLIRRKGKTSLQEKQALIFTRTRQRADRLAEALRHFGFEATSIHKGLSMCKRKAVIDEFKNSTIQFLIATDVMSRGIDIPFLPFVINFDTPTNPEDYIHRLGRTGRAERTGMAITFVSKKPMILSVGHQVVELNEQHLIKNIEKLLQTSIRIGKVPGPWKDTDQDAVSDVPKEENIECDTVISNKKLLQAKEEKVKLLLERIRSGKNSFMVRSKMRKRLKEELKCQAMGIHKEPAEISLRNFKEGRYEDVINSFDFKKAVKGGVKIPIPKKLRRMMSGKKGDLSSLAQKLSITN